MFKNIFQCMLQLICNSSVLLVPIKVVLKCSKAHLMNYDDSEVIQICLYNM